MKKSVFTCSLGPSEIDEDADVAAGVKRSPCCTLFTQLNIQNQLQKNLGLFRVWCGKSVPAGWPSSNCLFCCSSTEHLIAINSRPKMLHSAVQSLNDLGKGGCLLNMFLHLHGVKLTMLGSCISCGVHSDTSVGVKDQFVLTAVIPHASDLEL